MTPLLRSALACLLVAAVLSPAEWRLPSARAAPPSVRERRVEDIYASFRYGSGDNLRDYTVQAQRVFDAGTDELVRRDVFVGKIPCHRHDEASSAAVTFIGSASAGSRSPTTDPVHSLSSLGRGFAAA